MTKLEKTYKLLDKENISIYNYKLNNKSNALIVKNDSKYYIALDKNKCNNNTMENIVLNEELGHYYCNALYNNYSDPISVRKCEYRAKKWAYNVLVPINKLKEKITNGICNLYELAEDFEVNVEYMYDCLCFYKERGLLT